MIRVLLIYAATVVTALVAMTVALGVPFEWVAWPVLAVEVAIVATWGAVKLARHMRREARQTWTYTRPAPRLPQPYNPIIRIDAPEPKQIEAPRNTQEIDYAPRNVPRISSQEFRLIPAARANHRDSRGAD